MYIHHSYEFEVEDTPFQFPYLIECNIVKLVKAGMNPVYMCIIYLPTDFETTIGIRQEIGVVVTTETLLDHAYVKSKKVYEAGDFDFGGSRHKLIYMKRHKNVKLPAV